MTERIAYSTWDRMRKGRVRRAHIVVGAVTSEAFEGRRYQTKCHPGANVHHLLRSEHLKFVKEVDDLPPRTMPCESCFQCSDLPWYVAVATKEYNAPLSKTCSNVNGCGKRKPLEDFPRHPTKKYGRDSICKECLRERNKYYPRRSDTKSIRVVPAIHKMVKDWAADKGLGVQEAAIRLLRAGIEMYCTVPECVERRVRRGLCEGHHREIVERKVA